MAEQVYRRRFGDRKEGRLLRTLSPFYRMTPYIMVKRNDASNLFSDSLELSGIEGWLREKRRENLKGLGMLHLFIAAYVRTIASCPGLNRFVSGQKIFARNNIEVVMIVKRELTAEAEETSIKVVFDPSDTVYDVYRKLGEKVDEVKASAANGTMQTASALMNLPGIFLKFAIWFLNLLDYFGWLPKSLLDVSPFHGSLIITDLGSLGIAPIYHHLYNFGNLPVFLSMGAKRRELEPDKSGVMTEKKYIDYSVVMDERTVDGVYYANAFKYMKYYLKNPALLELPPERVVEDIF
ncbi:MAG: hypothetical protein IJ705_03955 [Oscillospiraceae bacterium]|nr:hypothetical protein [Oscillospiraceae bacterium]